jgi:predicted Zn-dependent protease
MDMQDRITVFEQMLADDPDNTMVMFGLAKEYEKAGRNDDVIAILERYLAAADDEGNAYGVLANAYARIGKPEKAVEAYKKGIDVSLAHGHPSMASDYKMTLDMDYGDEI